MDMTGLSLDLKNTRFLQQLSFLTEVDAMKNILRRTLLVDGSRRENDAEHSWHFALMAMVLYEYSDCHNVNLSRVLKMALVHDLIEIYAGDTFAYDVKGNEDKLARETAAADKLFALLPEDQGVEYRKLWEEFDARETSDAVYAAAIDCLQPFINNYLTQGHTWKEGNVHSAQVYERLNSVKKGAPDLWPFVEFVIEDSIQKGYLQR